MTKRCDMCDYCCGNTFGLCFCKIKMTKFCKNKQKITNFCKLFAYIKNIL